MTRPRLQVDAEAESSRLEKEERRAARMSEGEHRARSHCRFVLPVFHVIPKSLSYSVPLFLKRQCDRTLGEQRKADEAAKMRDREVRLRPELQ